MGGLLQPTPTPAEHERSNTLPVLIAFAGIALIVLIAVLATRQKPTLQTAPPLYASNIKFSDLKMSEAQNFVGSSVTYLDGKVANLGDKTVTQAAVKVTFRDAYGQVAQIESDVPLRILRNNGPTEDAVDLSMAPLGPGQSRTFRLIFERVSKQWNQGYPELEITALTTK